jgi:hypothetical protein
MLIPHRGQTSTILPAFSLLASKIGCLFSTGVSLATYFVVPDLVVSVTFGSTHVLHPLGLTAGGHQILHAVDLDPRYRRIAQRRAPQKANVAIQHLMLIAIWHIGTNGCLYDDPGADYFNRLHPSEQKTGPSPNSKLWATTSP